jgi:hypothetical protein
MITAPSEIGLWNDEKDETSKKLDDREINEKYSRGEGRIIIETNREKIPGFVEQLKTPNYLDLRPFYQRRPRWDVTCRSSMPMTARWSTGREAGRGHVSESWRVLGQKALIDSDHRLHGAPRQIAKVRRDGPYVRLAHSQMQPSTWLWHLALVARNFLH